MDISERLLQRDIKSLALFSPDETHRYSPNITEYSHNSARPGTATGFSECINNEKGMDLD
jgi:hypothetical protein